jgi:hypothetical protein
MSEAHAELGFWRSYVFSTDHKVIGLQYGITALLFLFFGFCLMMLMRWQLAYPGSSAPCTAPSWSSWGSCRSRSARSETTSFRSRSARPTWPFRG